MRHPAVNLDLVSGVEFTRSTEIDLWDADLVAGVVVLHLESTDLGLECVGLVYKSCCLAFRLFVKLIESVEIRAAFAEE